MTKIVLMFGLLMAGQVWANDSCNTCKPMEGAPHLLECTTLMCWPTVDDLSPLDACRAKMEAAMRAMDEFVSPFGLDSVQTIYRTPANQLRHEADRLERREKAIVQWELVKKECWRKP